MSEQLFAGAGLLVSILAGAFFLVKLRSEEALKMRLQFALEAYEVFTELNEAVRDWAHFPDDIPGYDRDAVLRRALNEFSPRVMRAFHRANLILRPSVGILLHGLQADVGEMLRHHKTWCDLQCRGTALRAEDEAACKAAWEQARVALPGKIDRAHKHLLHELHIVILGWAGAWWWKRRHRKLGVKYMVERGLKPGDL